MRDYSIDPGKGTLLSIPLFLGLAALVLVPYQILWRESAILAALDASSPPAMLALLLLTVVLHEALHGLGWMIAGGLKLSDLEFGVMWKVLTPYAHAKVPITARAYRIGGALPGLVLGLLPALAGIAIGSAVLAAWGALLLSVAAGDLLILLTLRSVPAWFLVRDHSSRFGCEVLEPGEIGGPARPETADPRSPVRR